MSRWCWLNGCGQLMDAADVYANVDSSAPGPEHVAPRIFLKRGRGNRSCASSGTVFWRSIGRRPAKRLDSVVADHGYRGPTGDIAPNTPILSQACTAFDTQRAVRYFSTRSTAKGPINFDLSGGHTQQTGT